MYFHLHGSALFGMVVHALCYVVMAHDVTKANIYALWVFLFLMGLPLGIYNVITYALIADAVDYLEWKTGERAEGICFAMQTFINKIGMAVGAFVGVISYKVAGINPTAADGVYITAGGKDTLWTLLILSGAISMALTIVPMLFYTITEDKQRKMVKEIEERKAR